MRAKNEYKFIAEAYDTKLLLERIVDGTLMCPEACCGAPVIECTCSKDCPHCNCFMIHKAMKSNGLTDKLLKENLRQHQFFKKGIGSAVKEIFDIPKDKPKEDEEHDDSDAALWKRQWRDQPDVSPEEVERLKNRKPKPQSYSKKHPKSKKVDFHPGYGPEEGAEDNLHPATRAGEEIVGSDVIWDNHQMKGIVKKVDVELGMAIVTDHKGEPHIVELGAFDAVLDPNTETPEEFKHLY